MVLELTENTAAVTLRHIDHNENPPFFAIYESDTLTGHTKTKPVGSFSPPTSPPPCPALTEVVTGKSLQKHRAIKYILNYHGLSNLKAQSHEILRTL